MGSFSRWYWLGTGYRTIDCYVIRDSVIFVVGTSTRSVSRPASLGRCSEVSREAARDHVGCSAERLEVRCAVACLSVSARVRAWAHRERRPRVRCCRRITNTIIYSTPRITLNLSGRNLGVRCLLLLTLEVLPVGLYNYLCIPASHLHVTLEMAEWAIHIRLC